MKRICCIILIIPFIYCNLSAQDKKDFLGLSLGFGTSTTSYNYSSLVSSYSYKYHLTTSIGSFTAEYGHYIYKNVALGFSMGYSTGSTSTNIAVPANENILSVTPFARFRLFNSNNFSLIGQAFIQYDNSFSDVNSVSWLIGISPGIEYKLSDKLVLEGLYGMIGWIIIPNYGNVNITTFTFLINNSFGPNFSGLGLKIFL